MFPASLSDITLQACIDWSDAVKPLDDVLKALQVMPDSKRKEVLLVKNHVDKADLTATHFGLPGLFVDDALQQYETFCTLFVEHQSEEPAMPELAEILFGQFIDLKMIIQGAGERNKWEVLKYIIATFCFSYEPENLNEESEVFLKSGAVSMSSALHASKWWDAINEQINKGFTLFQDSGEDEGDHMKQHMERWGWINFLKSLAKTKAFDIDGSGLNSIDAVRATKLEEVLIWASEEKDYNLAAMRDMQK